MFSGIAVESFKSLLAGSRVSCHTVPSGVYTHCVSSGMGKCPRRLHRHHCHPSTGTTEIHIPAVHVAEPWTSWGGQRMARHHCPEKRDGGRCLSGSRGESRERSRSWDFGDRQRHRCLQPESWREGHLASVGPDGTAHGFPLARDMSTEAAPKVTARLGRGFTELLLPPQLLGFGRLVDLQTTSCSPPIKGGLPGDLPEDSAHQPLP